MCSSSSSSSGTGAEKNDDTNSAMAAATTSRPRGKESSGVMPLIYHQCNSLILQPKFLPAMVLGGILNVIMMNNSNIIQLAISFRIQVQRLEPCHGNYGVSRAAKRKGRCSSMNGTARDAGSGCRFFSDSAILHTLLYKPLEPMMSSAGRAELLDCAQVRLERQT